jgi:hypothetical protein
MYANRIHEALVEAYKEGSITGELGNDGEHVIESFKEEAISLDNYMEGYNKGYAKAEIIMKERYSFQIESHRRRIEELENKLATIGHAVK